MTSTNQTLASEDGSAVAVSKESISSSIARYVSAFGEPIRAVSDAVVNAVSNPPSSHYAAAFMHEADRQIARLNSMRGCGPGWAGPFSEAPSDSSLDAAISLISKIRYFPLPMPMASVGTHGNAGLCWSDNQLYADIELLEDGRIGYLLQLAGHDAVDAEGEIPEIGLPADIGKALASAYLKHL